MLHRLQPPISAVMKWGRNANHPMLGMRTVYSCLELLAQRNALPWTAPK